MKFIRIIKYKHKHLFIILGYGLGGGSSNEGTVSTCDDCKYLVKPLKGATSVCYKFVIRNCLYNVFNKLMLTFFLGTFDNFGVNRKSCSCSDEYCALSAGLSLPNPRLVSAVFHSDSDVPDSKATHMVTQMGQFLDHDITLTPETHAEECCEHPELDENCFPISIPSVDPFYSLRSAGPVRCLEFTRSTGFCEEEDEREDSHHEQINGKNKYEI